MKIIQETRVKLDQLTKAVKSLKGSREISISITSLQNGRMWLGQVLEVIGTENPYVNDGKRHTVNDIHKLSDASDSGLDLTAMNHIEKVDFLRESIKDLKIKLGKLNKEKAVEMLENADDRKFLIASEQFLTCLSYATKYVIEARMWLGQELGRIRDENIAVK
jgi:CO dehydrogenase/acetyl-CoA synthase gamma subunit (corrinoid Fe-S protein)